MTDKLFQYDIREQNTCNNDIKVYILNKATHPVNAIVLWVAPIVVHHQYTYPVVKRRDTKQSNHWNAKAAEMKRIIASEGTDSQYRKQIEDEHHQEKDVGNWAQAFHEPNHNNLKSLYFSNQLEELHQSEETKKGDIKSRQLRRYPAYRYKPKVEIVPHSLFAKPIGFVEEWKIDIYSTVSVR